MAQEKALQDDDQAWMGGDDENYTIAEPDRAVSSTSALELLKKMPFQSQTGSPDPMFLKLNADDNDYVDVEGGIQPGDELDSTAFKMRKIRSKPKKKATDTLEEGLSKIYIVRAIGLLTKCALRPPVFK